MRLSSKPALARYSAAMRLSASLIRLLPEKSYKISKQHISAACLLAAGAWKGDVELRKEEKEVIMTKNRENVRDPPPAAGKEKRYKEITNSLSITFPQYHFTTDYRLIFCTFFASFNYFA